VNRFAVRGSRLVRTGWIGTDSWLLAPGCWGASKVEAELETGNW